jgi:hypothetical protein
MTRGHSIVGSSRKNGEREKDDFYPTPAYAVKALLEEEMFHRTIWEPACGDGAISEVLKAYQDPNLSGGSGFKVVSSDIVDRGYGEHLGADFDFLNLHYPERMNPLLKGDFDIITNPPFKYATEFVLHAKKFAKNKVAMFLKLSFLEGIERKKLLFSDKEFPLSRIYVFSARVPIWKGGVQGKNSGMIAFAWFVWDKNHTEHFPTVHWI